MAKYSVQAKQDLTGVFDAMEKSRTLEGVIDMAAELQVMGGGFAALADPMSMLFESRNDPEKYG